MTLFVVTNMGNEYFWLIMAGSSPSSKGDGNLSSVCSRTIGGGYIFPNKGRVW